MEQGIGFRKQAPFGDDPYADGPRISQLGNKAAEKTHSRSPAGLPLQAHLFMSKKVNEMENAGRVVRGRFRIIQPISFDIDISFLVSKRT